MRIDLREIIHIPGASVSFDYAPDVSELDFHTVEEITVPIRAAGTVKNEAGVLTLRGRITGELHCICDRCAAAFVRSLDLPITATVAEENFDEENFDIYLLDGDMLDLDEVIITAYVLEMDMKTLCRPDCKGLCPDCGQDMNQGVCACGRKTDPRLAVLEQLLKDN